MPYNLRSSSSQSRWELRSAVVAYIGSSYRQQARFQSDLSFRDITVRSRTDDPGLFASGEPLPQRLGSVSLEPVVSTAADLEGVRDAAPSVDYAYINEYHGGIYGDRPFNLNAVTADYLTAARIQVTEGSTLAPSDFRETRPVMLITPEGAAQAFIMGDPIGKGVIDPSDSTAYTIVGLLPSSDDLVLLTIAVWRTCSSSLYTRNTPTLSKLLNFCFFLLTPYFSSVRLIQPEVAALSLERQQNPAS